MKRIDTTGGAAQVLANTPLARGGSWNADDVILYSPSPSRGIWRIPASGGTPTAVTLGPIDDGATRIYPYFLADGVADEVGFSLGIIGYSPISIGGDALAFGPAVRSITALQWRERNGTVGSVIGRGEYRSPRLSPDGSRLAITILDPKANSPDVWTMDSARSRATTIYLKAIAANEPERQVIPPTNARYPVDVTREGILFQSAGLSTESGGYDLGWLPVIDRGAERVLASTPFNEVQARVSPNGRWMAYASDESGRYEVYVRDFPAGRDQVTISRAGGMQPEWRADGRELFFISADGHLMSVAVSGDTRAFSAQLPRPLFTVDVPQPTPPYPNDYAVTADGQRCLVNTLVEQPALPLTVVLNWKGGK